MANAWDVGDKAFSQSCSGKVWVYRGIHWQVLYRETLDGTMVEAHRNGSGQVFENCMLECAKAASQMQAQFPMLNIVTSENAPAEKWMSGWELRDCSTGARVITALDNTATS